MESLRTLRRSRALTFLDLSTLTGIPARALAEAEYGLRRLDYSEREALAFVLGLGPADMTGAHAALATRPLPGWAGALSPQQLLAAALVVTVASGALRGLDLPRLSLPALPASVAEVDPPVARALPRAAGALAWLDTDPAADDAAAIWRRSLALLAEHAASAGPEALAPALLGGPPPAAPPVPAPVPPPAPAFTLTEAGPLGCPVQPAAGRVMLTQGYGVGTHAPAEVWGAVDLAVDGDGDGFPEAGASWYAPIVATHDGVVRVTLDSHPAGNHVWVMEPGGVWRTGYSHLALVTVVSGQFVRAGEQIGMLGSSGMSSGPHLDYQVWRGGVNLDPTSLVGCG